MSPASFATHRGTCNSTLVACTRAAHFQTGESALQVAKKENKVHRALQTERAGEHNSER